MNKPGSQVTIAPLTINNKMASFRLPTFHSLYPILHSLNLTPIGCDYFSCEMEFMGYVPPNWRPYHSDYKKIWLSTDAFHKWSQITHRAFTEEKGDIADLASRIRFQIEAITWRLREISESYTTELRAQVEQGKFEENKKFSTGYSFKTFLTIHSYLIDASTLRDYLAEFLAEYVFQNYLQQKTKICRMSSLRNKVLRLAKNSDKLAKELFEATDPVNNGWLAELSNYRDLAVHAAPLAQAKNRVFIVNRLSSIKSDKVIPSIFVPLPNNPSLIISERSKGLRGLKFQDWLDRLWNDRDLNSCKDSLEYCLLVQGKLANLAIAVAELSPIKAKPIVIPPEDIIDVKITS